MRLDFVGESVLRYECVVLVRLMDQAAERGWRYLDAMQCPC